MSLPPTTLFPPNAVVEIQPGMIVQAASIITPLATSTLITAQGAKPNTSVSIQPGMNARAIVSEFVRRIRYSLDAHVFGQPSRTPSELGRIVVTT